MVVFVDTTGQRLFLRLDFNPMRLGSIPTPDVINVHLVINCPSYLSLKKTTFDFLKELVSLYVCAISNK